LINPLTFISARFRQSSAKWIDWGWWSTCRTSPRERWGKN